MSNLNVSVSMNGLEIPSHRPFVDGIVNFDISVEGRLVPFIEMNWGVQSGTTNALLIETGTWGQAW